MPSKLAIPPDKLSFGIVAGNEVVRLQVQGGSSRFRRDLIGANPTVSAQWTLTRDEYTYLTLFWRSATLRGASSFTVDMFLDSSSIAEYTCYFLPETFQLVSNSEDTFVVSAQMEVEPLAVNLTEDNALIAEFGDNTKLALIPDQAQYTAIFSNEAIRVQFDGGAGAYRRGIRSDWHTVTAQWTLTPHKYDYMMAFRRTAIANGSLPFEIDLMVDSDELLTYKAFVIPETFQLISHNGISFVVTAQLEVEPLEPSDDYEASLLMLLSVYGDDAELFLDELAQLVNVNLNAVA